MAGFELDGRRNLVLAELGRQRIDRAGSDRRMLQQHLLDLERRNVLAAPANGVLHAVEKAKASVRLTHDAVAGMEPEVAPSLDRLVRHREIARRDREGLDRPHQQFPRFAVRQRIVLGVDDGDIEAGPHAAHRSRALFAGRVAQHEIRFGRTVTVYDRDAETSGERP